MQIFHTAKKEELLFDSTKVSWERRQKSGKVLRFFVLSRLSKSIALFASQMCYKIKYKKFANERIWRWWKRYWKFILNWISLKNSLNSARASNFPFFDSFNSENCNTVRGPSHPLVKFTSFTFLFPFSSLNLFQLINLRFLSRSGKLKSHFLLAFSMA